LDLAQSLHWQIRRTFNCISPYDIAGKRKLRIGGMRDGGYVMLDGFDHIHAAYSLGVGGDVSWDLEMANRGIPVHQFDHTVSAPPSQHPLFSFNKQGIAAQDGGEFVSIPSILRRNGHAGRRDLILKIDIECHEWDAFDATPSEDLACFEQIVIELHGFLRFAEPEWRAKTQRVLGKLFQTHVSYHVHANNWADFQIIEGVPVPDVLEVGYIRRDSHVITPSGAMYPTPFDIPCHPDRPDIMLGNFRFM
jgi:hypothetical protein